MIPISLKPKRFPSALGNGRARKGLLFSAMPKKWPNSNKTTAFFVAPLSSIRGFSTIGRIGGPKQGSVYDIQSFSTVTQLDNNCPKVVTLSSDQVSTVSDLEQYITIPQKNEIHLFGQRDENWWTGKPPLPGVCPGVEADGGIYSLPQLTFQASKDIPLNKIPVEAARIRALIQEYFDNTWTLTEVLLSSLQGEAAFMRSPYHDLRHPMIFYYGHPAALYINKLRVAGLLKEPINPYYEVIFETGVDEMSWDDLSKNTMTWPSVTEVHTYRQQVYQTVSNLISNLSDEQCLNINENSPLWALVMSFEHERIHIETSSFLISELPLEYVRFPEGFPAYHSTAKLAANTRSSNESTSTTTSNHTYHMPVSGIDYPVNRMIPVPTTEVTLGKPRDFPSFGWDNEYGKRTYTVPSFQASEYKVTNGEYLEFILDNGYARNELWTAVGWEWRAYRNIKHPTHFIRIGPQGAHQYKLRLLFDETTEVPWDWPVVVNFHEATAFAKWKSLQTGKKIRILTELEHNAIREESGILGMVEKDPITVVGGNTMMKQMGFNTNLACASMSPVNALSPNSKGFYDVFGNAWEWTEDFFCALPGFKIHPYYEDFSTPCFDGLHYIIQGCSYISTGNECSTYSRFHFRPHFYQHASFRYVEVEEGVNPLPTSDCDAPGPFVGSYPYRSSEKALIESRESKNKQLQKDFFNNTLLKHFVASPVLNHNTSVMAQFAECILKQAQLLHIPTATAHFIEVGCGPGGLTFELAKQCGTTTVSTTTGTTTGSTNTSFVGIDHNAELIDTARKLSQGEEVVVCFPVEGDQNRAITIAAPHLTTTTGSNSDTSTTVNEISPIMSFRTADPMCLPAELRDFDIVILHDVIDKISTPNSLLGRLGGMRGLVRPGGMLVVSSAYQWNEECTPKDLWLCTPKQTNHTDTTSTTIPTITSTSTSETALIQRLQEEFNLVHTDPAMLQIWPEGGNSRQVRGTAYSVTYFQRK